MTRSASLLHIEVWSDIACPWCWLGKRHLEQALARSGATDAEVRFRSYELQPRAGAAVPAREYLLPRYGEAGMRAAQERLADAGRAVGLAYDFERQLMANTFDAHRVHHLAQARGVGAPVLERLMQAYHGEGADVSDHATLARLAAEAGLDEAAVRDVLAGDAYADAVRADEAEAAAIGVTGLPFFVIDRRVALSGAQPVEVFERALAHARTKAPRQ